MNLEFKVSFASDDGKKNFSDVSESLTEAFQETRRRSLPPGKFTIEIIDQSTGSAIYTEEV
jgi:hypothetical protein